MNWWTATTRGRCAGGKAGPGAGTSTCVPDGTGRAGRQATLLAHDAAALDQRLDAMAAAVCDADPRTCEQRRADAMGALGHGADRLACRCGTTTARPPPRHASAVVVHVIAEAQR